MFEPKAESARLKAIIKFYKKAFGFMLSALCFLQRYRYFKDLATFKLSTPCANCRFYL